MAWTCHDYADTMLQRGDPGDREKAMRKMRNSGVHYVEEALEAEVKVLLDPYIPA
ncbi:MAG: hypothetical protein O6914_02240 [Chloroflexi bacterium]|nr:hypothetical protein [Chloroflexota bacterium]